jgi:hypothetical protein
MGVDAEVVKEVVQHAGLRVNRHMYLRLQAVKLIYPTLDLSDPLHCMFYMVHPIIDIPLEG